MGQKVHPTGFRVGITRGWDSNWYADKDYARYVEEDLKIRRHIKRKLHSASISRVVVERAANKAKVYVHAAKPGIILGKRSAGKRTAGLDALRAELMKLTSTEVFVNIIEVRKSETDATLVAENIAAQLAKTTYGIIGVKVWIFKGEILAGDETRTI
jgi:small subunit ribosomal protein S3